MTKDQHTFSVLPNEVQASVDPEEESILNIIKTITEPAYSSRLDASRVSEAISLHLAEAEADMSHGLKARAISSAEKFAVYLEAPEKEKTYGWK